MRTVNCLQKINTEYSVVNSCAKFYEGTHEKHKQCRERVIKVLLILK